MVADVAARGLAGASGGMLTLRAPWLLVEARDRLKTNRDGEPTLESSRWAAATAATAGGPADSCQACRARGHRPRPVGGRAHRAAGRSLVAASGGGAAATPSCSNSAASPHHPAFPRLLFEVRPKAIRLHLPDDRLLVSGLPEAERAAAARVSTPARPKHRRAMLRDLLRAQQPPGRMGRRLAGLRRLAARLFGAAVVFAAGFVAGALRGARP
jgi:hypothetical protein